MKIILLILLMLSTATVAYNQNKDSERIDTATKTQIEKTLSAVSTVHKVEFVNVDEVKWLKIQIVVVTDLNLNNKIKGLSLSNEGLSAMGGEKYERHVYLDEQEISDLISFMEKCDQTWKKDKPGYETQYTFETADNLKITFSTLKNSKNWNYNVRFTNYAIENEIDLDKNKPDDLLDALHDIKKELQNL
jgi:hypothetical protein